MKVIHKAPRIAESVENNHRGVDVQKTFIKLLSYPFIESSLEYDFSKDWADEELKARWLIS